MTITKKELHKGVYKFTVTVPADHVSDLEKEVTAALAKNTTLKGFRPGAAPLNLVKEAIDPGKLYGELINHLVPEIMAEIVKTDKLEIITQPKVQVVKFDPGSAAELEVTLITTPVVNLKGWSEKIKMASPTSKEDALEKFLTVTNIDLPDEIINEERDRMLGRLLTQLQTLGLEINAYAKSQNKTVEDLKKDYATQAEKSLKTHFALEQLVKEENVTVSDEEITATINAAPDENSKKTLESPEQKWYIMSILARNKALEIIYAYVNPDSH